MTVLIEDVTDVVERIADAVLYEGYILYPYRPSAVKNQQRWNFGVVCPGAYAEEQRGTETATMQTECLVISNGEPRLDIKFRFLHLIVRQVCRLEPECNQSLKQCGHLSIAGIADHLQPVASLSCNGSVLQTWQEAVEREVVVQDVTVREITTRTPFSYPAVSSHELVFDNQSGNLMGLLVRTQAPIRGSIETNAFQCNGDDGLCKLTIRIHNETLLSDAAEINRDEALLRSFVSAHTILCMRDGQFVSLLDPPEFARDVAAACTNIGTYPVLASDPDRRDQILSSPIILYDYPQIAAESAGDLCDGTEIDEILSLRIMTLTDEEKREIRDADDRARAILERTENMPAEQFLKMHGVMKRL